MENGAGRQADSQIGRCALSARQWGLCGRYSYGPDAVCSRVPKCLGAWARTAHPHGNGRGAARGNRGIHPSRFCRAPSPDPVADCVHAGLRKISSAADRDGEGSLRRRADGGGSRDKPIPRRRRRVFDLRRGRGAGRDPGLGSGEDIRHSCSRTGWNKFFEGRCGPRRRRGGVSDCLLCTTGNVQRAAPHGCSPGNKGARCRLGSQTGAHDRIRRNQGAFFQTGPRSQQCSDFRRARS
jgi:hypothetical protein